MHNDMLMRHSISLENLSRTIPPIDEDQKVALVHAPFKGTTLFRGELHVAKLQKATIEHASSLTVFPAVAATSLTYAPKPYAGRSKSFKRGGNSYIRGCQERDHDRSAPSATIAKLSSLGTVKLP